MYYGQQKTANLVLLTAYLVRFQQHAMLNWYLHGCIVLIGCLHRRSYECSCFIELSEMGEKNKMRGLRSILSFFFQRV